MLDAVPLADHGFGGGSCSAAASADVPVAPPRAWVEAATSAHALVQSLTRLAANQQGLPFDGLAPTDRSDGEAAAVDDAHVRARDQAQATASSRLHKRARIME